MSPQTELTLLNDYLDRLNKARKKMDGQSVERARRTIRHLEARIYEIKTGMIAEPW
jgi:hypothetical protein